MKSVLRIRDVYTGSRILDPTFVHPGSRIRMLTFYPSRIPGSKRHRIPDPGSATLTWTIFTEYSIFSITLYGKLPF